MSNDQKPHLHVEFYVEPQENKAESRKAGRPIFREVEMVKIMIAGDPKNTLVAPAHSSKGANRETGEQMTYAKQFPEHYRLFKAQQSQHMADGTPLDEVPWLTVSRRAELKALSIFTVEQLASLDGTPLNRIGMDGRSLKNQAQAWLDKAAGAAVESRLADELAVRDELIERLRADIEQLKAGASVPETSTAQMAEPSIPASVEDSPFMAWDDEDIKVWIKDATGARPAGNPSHATLVAKADEINDRIAAERQPVAA